MILFNEEHNNRYRLAAKNSSVINEGIHPALLEPFKGLEIENKVLSITFSCFQSMGTWEITEYMFKFLYQNEAFTLIGKDYSSSWRNRAYPERKISCNYLTGKKKTVTEIPIDDYNSRFETIWTDK